MFSFDLFVMFKFVFEFYYFYIFDEIDFIKFIILLINISKFICESKDDEWYYYY